MDGHRFDDPARAFSPRSNRRSFITRVAAGIAAGLIARAGAGEKVPDEQAALRRGVLPYWALPRRRFLLPQRRRLRRSLLSPELHLLRGRALPRLPAWPRDVRGRQLPARL